MRGGACAAAVGLALALLPSAAEAATSPAEVAARLPGEVVVVAPGAERLLPVPEAGRLRIAIADSPALGRIKVAVVPRQDAEAAGGVGAFANAVDRALEPPLRGTLLVATRGGLHAITSHPASEAVVAVLRRAADRHPGDLPRQLRSAVRGVAEVDPGPAADPVDPAAQAPVDPGTLPGESFVEEAADAVRTAIFAIAAAVVLALAIPIALLLARARRRRRHAARTHELALEALRSRLVALGDAIRTLDEDPAVPPARYAGALDAYDRAGLLLARDVDEAEAAEAGRCLDAGERALAAARTP